MVITMAKLRMAHASTHGARKPPGPKDFLIPPTLIWGVNGGVSNDFSGCLNSASNFIRLEEERQTALGLQ